ncbi:bifunctional 4-hydroxy-2-oxoglutarate aldolase/2-dehydro-3-deoxy-phosphogluconate aldolase [Polycladomyces sp. WAk]|uniref:Bifunctional 4-hydroxy-2-oxoglutarate aldolase/2-dehydro-3-deoxy-phosphogluconate aldolase n=1 Tax=Polycladomyces zharkentensis TaxID=2807616 RepID=A0ABS2WMN2_9BACL|nr:bifunctional 4-hydroxy-2-oxoglutarate aldolase/2-dehydro-3-deoxy-phosphogluconate aldolase [Polycladomyces sp. WAk]MBN2910832.1 bifunctional 4-hydroxy-2-oxoglutarate aldolase/2-dehydro-3-deoxy-phosphogluconate aldolase [Polycladomyces sp. WAk]
MSIEKIKENGIIAIIRGHRPEDIVSIVGALHEGGVRTVEITMDTPGIGDVIERVLAEFGREMLIGAGTVLDPESARLALMAGARFIFSPSLNVETIRMAKRYGAISIPGVLTPTEILTAYEQGADAVKVFPISVLGPEYLKAVRDPLPHIPIIPTGGITLHNIGAYFQNGVIAVGLGGALVPKTTRVDSVYLQELKRRAAQFVDSVRQVRQP